MNFDYSGPFTEMVVMGNRISIGEKDVFKKINLGDIAGGVDVESVGFCQVASRGASAA